MEYIIIFFRIITIMALLLFSTLFIMGKRPIGELPVFDFLSLIVMGAIVGADIADPNIEHLPTAFAVLVLALVQRFISNLILSNRKINKWVTFEPTIIIQNGKLIYKNLKKVKYSVEEVLMLLREKDIFDISLLEYAIIEPSGKVSIMRKDQHEQLTKEDMNISYKKATLPVVVILEGKLNKRNLMRIQMTERDLVTKLQEQGFSDIKDIFFASLDQTGQLSVSPYQVLANEIKI